MANAHVVAACIENKISLDDFFGTLRSRRILAARRAAIIRLRSLGLSYRACARIMKRDHTMIRYWVKEKVRDRKRETMRARKQALSLGGAA
jgi:chromosomal replication initiation ATPase DnaA